MKRYYKIAGGHTHVRVFMNSAKCGELCFRNEEFEMIRDAHRKAYTGGIIEFVEE